MAHTVERLSIELSDRCAKACWFCHSASRPDGAAAWDPDAVVAFVRDCAAHGVRAVSCGGGEPLEYPAIHDVLAALRGVIFRSLTTNGLALDVAALAASAPDKVHVSIHFPERAAEVARVIGGVRALDAAGSVRG